MTDTSSIDEQQPEIKRTGPPKGLPVEATRRPFKWLYPTLVLASLLIGVMASYVIWGRGETEPVTQVQSAVPSSSAGKPADTARGIPELASLIEQINPAGGYTLPARYGNLGPRLLEAGVIDFETLATVFEDSGSSLSQDEVDVLKRGSDQQVTITAENARFLLNFFWAVGLANRNSILTEGPIVENSDGQIDRYASTGGWGLATRPVTEIYASMDLIMLTEEQQRRVEEVAAVIYRPCCNNPTLFPDCNHGMAMLGLLELMASQGASSDEMFTAAKYVNAFWFPQQTLETAVYLKATQNTEFVDADARLVVSEKFSSGSGSSALHQALQSAGLLEQTPGQSNGCSN